MKKLIHNLRQKPPHIRRMVAFVTSIVVTSLIGLIWISNLVAIGISTPSEAPQVEKTPSPFAMMVGQIKDLFKSSGDDLASIGDAFKNTVATSSDGAIGISTTNQDSSSTSLTEEQ